MPCGTPEVTTNWGAAPELEEDGVTGLRRDEYSDLAAALMLVDHIAPEACRARVEDRFSAGAMVRGYERIYEQVADRR
jgi:glycosyltransferase involved in cell wall biosynthesis